MKLIKRKTNKAQVPKHIKQIVNLKLFIESLIDWTHCIRAFNRCRLRYSFFLWRKDGITFFAELDTQAKQVFQGLLILKYRHVLRDMGGGRSEWSSISWKGRSVSLARCYLNWNLMDEMCTRCKLREFKIRL